MIDKHTEQEARRMLPEPASYDNSYIDIHVPRKNGMYEVVTFVKSEKDGQTIWMVLPYAR
ncbi:hypothetical protein M2273_002357 [Mucilaginibacter lappiensis]